MHVTSSSLASLSLPPPLPFSLSSPTFPSPPLPSPPLPSPLLPYLSLTLPSPLPLPSPLLPYLSLSSPSSPFLPPYLKDDYKTEPSCNLSPVLLGEIPISIFPETTETAQESQNVSIHVQTELGQRQDCSLCRQTGAHTYPQKMSSLVQFATAIATSVLV